MLREGSGWEEEVGSGEKCRRVNLMLTEFKQTNSVIDDIAED